MKRRKILLVGGLAALGATAPGLTALRPLAARAANRAQLAEAMEIFDDDRFMGEESAPITIVEYASMTCPHCATFHKETLPELKETWIARGDARMIFRHYPLDGLALRAAALADCFEGDRFFGFVDLLFKTQENWARARDPLEALQKLAKQAGMGESQSEACLKDEAQMDKIFKKLSHARNTYEIRSTPSFVVNDRKVEGAKSFKEFDKILKESASDG